MRDGFLGTFSLPLVAFGVRNPFIISKHVEVFLIPRVNHFSSLCGEEFVGAFPLGLVASSEFAESIALTYIFKVRGEVLNFAKKIDIYTTREDDAVLGLEVPIAQEVWDF